MQMAPKMAPRMRPSIRQPTTRRQKPAEARWVGGSQCGETASGAAAGDAEPVAAVPGNPGEGGVEEIIAAPQAGQKATSLAMTLPHFEQNMRAPVTRGLRISSGDSTRIQGLGKRDLGRVRTMTTLEGGSGDEFAKSASFAAEIKAVENFPRNDQQIQNG